MIEPLYQGRSAHEVLSALTGQNWTPGLESVRATWMRHWDGLSGFEARWQTSVHDGVIAGTKFTTRSVPLAAGWPERLQGALTPPRQSGAGSYELVFQPDPTIQDGRFANNGWLQELPKPLTKVTWDNVALMSPTTALELGVGLGSYARAGEHGGYHPDVVELQVGGRTVQAPVWIMPGHADGSITVSLGYGRDQAGRVGGTSSQRVGFNAYRLRTLERPWFAPGWPCAKRGPRCRLLAPRDIT